MGRRVGELPDRKARHVLVRPKRLEDVGEILVLEILRPERRALVAQEDKGNELINEMASMIEEEEN